MGNPLTQTVLLLSAERGNVSIVYFFLFVFSLAFAACGYYLSGKQDNIATHFWLASIWLLLVGIFFKMGAG